MSTTFEKTWAFDLNRAYAPVDARDLTRYTMWYLAAALTGNIGGLTLGLWTLYASSDSATAGTDATDRWVLAGPYDGTKIVRASGASAHSWIVLKSPTMNGSFWYMILSFNSAADAAIRFSVCKTAPTGGSTTVTPTATDQWWPGLATSTTAGDTTMNAAAADNSRFNIGLTSVGDWYFLGCKQFAAVPNLCLQFHALANKKVNDQLPVWVMKEYLATGVCRIATGAGPFNSNNPCSHTARKFDATVATNGNPILTWGEGLSTFAPTVVDALDGTYADLPCWIGTGGVPPTGPTSIRGRVVDIATSPNTPASLPEATVAPSVGGIDSCRAGNLWFPANAAFNFS